MSVVQDIVSSSQIIKDDNLVKVYPNPFKNSLVVATDEEWSQLSIFNVLGGLVYEDTEYQAMKSLQLSLQRGIYYVKLKTNNGEKLVKVIKK
ncbi:MAG: hypothetical protein CMP67_03875 [Flavobacteriales bacterium]|nr:hypothetical protein [Flavobacteriales bacterium]